MMKVMKTSPAHLFLVTFRSNPALSRCSLKVIHLHFELKDKKLQTDGSEKVVSAAVEHKTHVDFSDHWHERQIKHLPILRSRLLQMHLRRIEDPH